MVLRTSSVARLGFSLAFLSFLAQPLLATTIPLYSLGHMSRKASLAFAGTVDRISYRTADDGRPLTDIRFIMVKFARGQGKRDTVTLSLWGGRDRGDLVSIDGMPDFELGRRYVVLATNRGTSANWYLPIVGLTQ